MGILAVWLVNKSGSLIYRRTFEREPKDLAPVSADRLMQLGSTMYSLDGFTKEIANCGGVQLVEGSHHNLHVHFTPTGLCWILVTDPFTGNVAQVWNDIYSAYSDFVLKNPFYVFDSSGIGQPIQISAFNDAIDDIVAKENARR